jgi:hypothetical protein
MTDDSHALAIEGIRFFGEISASISHEIKNVLAIINENAGLLQDMIMMSEKGLPLNPERLSKLAHSISGQVARGDRIVKGMNQFAHSADVSTETVDVGAVVHFVSDLAARLIAMKGAAPQIDAPLASVTTTTNRFFLENLVWPACAGPWIPVPRIERYPWLQKKVKTPPESGFAALLKMRLPMEQIFPHPGKPRWPGFSTPN